MPCKCIGRGDDLLAGKSYYLVEAETVVSLRRAVPRNERGRADRGGRRGSRRARRERPAARGAGGDARRRALVDLLRDKYAAYHLADSIGPNGLIFEYRLMPGEATIRNAIALLELSGAPDAVVRRAR